MSARRAAIVAPAALAAVLVLVELGTRSIWLDEGASIAIASSHGSALWGAIAHDGGNMLGYYLALHGLIAFDVHAISQLRLPSAVCGVAAVALVAALGVRQVSWRAGLAAGLLGAVSLPMVFWSQDIRGYAPMMALVCGSFLLLAMLLDASDPRRARWLACGYAVCTVLALYCAFTAVLVVPAQVLGIVLARGSGGSGPSGRSDPSGRSARSGRLALIALGAVALSAVPLLVLAVQRGSGQLFWAGEPTLNELGQSLRWLTSAGMPPNFRATWAAVTVLIATLAVLAALPVWLVVARLADGGREPAPRLTREQRTGWLLVAWVVIPLTLNLVESFAGQPVLLSRNSLVSLPAVALALGWVIGHPRTPAVLGGALLVALLALRAAVLVPSYGTSPEDWRGAVTYVLAGAAAGDCIAFYPQDGRMPFDVYVRADGAGAAAPRPILPLAPWGFVQPFVESYLAPALVPHAAGCRRLWVVDSHAGLRRGPPISRANLRRFESLAAGLVPAFRQVSRRSFGYAAAVDVTLYVRPAKRS